MNNTLSKKTRSQLIEIIMRKDDIEKHRSEQVKELSKTNEELLNSIKEKNLEIINLTTDNNDYRDLIDNYTTEIAELNNRMNKHNIIVFCCLIVALIANIIIWML